MDDFALKQKQEIFERFCEEFDRVRSISEIRHELRYSVYKIEQCRPIDKILDSYEGKIRQVGIKFKNLKEQIKREIAIALKLEERVCQKEVSYSIQKPLFED